MKINKLTIILIIIIILLLGYIIYDKVTIVNNNSNNKIKDIDNTVKIIDSIKLDYVTIYLASDGVAYLVPITDEEIKELNIGERLAERLNTLYGRIFYYDIYVDNSKIKGFRVKLDNDITSIKKIDTHENTYIFFIKENYTVGVFNYADYYNKLDTTAIDNYNNLKNVSDILDNKIIYLDGSSEKINLEE